MVTDTIADMLTRIRNANQMKYNNVAVLNTKMTREIASILKEEGYDSLLWWLISVLCFSINFCINFVK